MITTYREWGYACGMNDFEKCLYLTKPFFKIKGFCDPGIAYITHLTVFERCQAICLIVGTHQARLIAHFPWPVPGAGTIGGSAIKWDTNDTYIHLLKGLRMRRPHKGRYPGEAWSGHRIIKRGIFI